MNRLFRHIAAAIALLTLIAAALACSNDDGCQGNRSSIPLAGFYSSQSGSKIQVDSISVFGIGMKGDTMIVDHARLIDRVYLPLNVADTLSRFVVRYDALSLAAFNLADTISVTYKPIPYFHSEDCGAMYLFDIVDYSTTNVLIDSISFSTMHIDNANNENVRIFFRTQEEDVEQ